MIRFIIHSAYVVLLIGSAVSAQSPLDYSRDIRPILSDSCYNCHGPDEAARESELRLDDRASVLSSKVLSNGAMLERLTTSDHDMQMPPPDSTRILRPEDRDTLIKWLKQGGEWPEDDRHWAFIPPVRPALPETKNTDWGNNEIDTFVLARIENQKLKPSDGADKATLLRRITFDLTGLPPTQHVLDEFLHDDSPDAYEKVVDRLLRCGWQEGVSTLRFLGVIMCFCRFPEFVHFL